MKDLFNSIYPRLKYFICDLINDETLAKDIAQDSFAVFWLRRENFRHARVREVTAFLFTVGKNKCYDLQKHSKMKALKHSTILVESQNFEDLVEARIIKEDLFQQIYVEMQQLPPSQRQLLHMIFVEGMETDEIAEKMGFTPNNVRNLKARALQKLRSLVLKKRLFLIFLSSL